MQGGPAGRSDLGSSKVLKMTSATSSSFLLELSHAIDPITPVWIQLMKIRKFTNANNGGLYSSPCSFNQQIRKWL